MKQRSKQQTEVLFIALIKAILLSIIFILFSGFGFLIMDKLGEKLLRSWAENCCFGCSCLQHSWPRVFMRKLLNISHRDSDYGADTEDEDDMGSESESEGQLSIFPSTLYLKFWIFFLVRKNLRFFGVFFNVF